MSTVTACCPECSHSPVWLTECTQKVLELKPIAHETNQYPNMSLLNSPRWNTERGLGWPEDTPIETALTTDTPDFQCVSPKRIVDLESLGPCHRGDSLCTDLISAGTLCGIWLVSPGSSEILFLMHDRSWLPQPQLQS
jgi:hypothetical protein